jgi:thiol-disulfide isomerase/thioredoxin
MSLDISLTPVSAPTVSVECGEKFVTCIPTSHEFETFANDLSAGKGDDMVTLLVHTEWCSHCVRYLPVFNAGASSEDKRYTILFDVLRDAAKESPLANDVFSRVKHFPFLVAFTGKGLEVVGRVHGPRR